MLLARCLIFRSCQTFTRSRTYHIASQYLQVLSTPPPICLPSSGSSPSSNAETSLLTSRKTSNNLPTVPGTPQRITNHHFGALHSSNQRLCSLTTLLQQLAPLGFLPQVSWHCTRAVLRWRPVGSWSGGNMLWASYCFSIMTACWESLLVACLFWKRHVEGMVDRCPGTVRVLLERLQELIVNLHGKHLSADYITGKVQNQSGSPNLLGLVRMDIGHRKSRRHRKHPRRWGCVVGCHK